MRKGQRDKAWKAEYDKAFLTGNLFGLPRNAKLVKTSFFLPRLARKHLEGQAAR